MEHFRGSLSSYRLPLLMPALFEVEPLSGELSVRRGARCRRFFVRDARVVAVASTDPKEHLTQALVERGLLELSRAAHAFEEARAKGEHVGQYLVEASVIAMNDLCAVLEQKAKDSLFDCYQWESGDVEWRTGALAPIQLGLSLELAGLHNEALGHLRAWNELSRELPPSDALLIPAERCEALAASQAEAELLSRIGCGVTAGELLSEAPRRLELGRTLVGLLRRGALRVSAEGRPVRVSIAELVDQARTSLEQGDYEAATATAERALEAAAVPEAEALYREAEHRLGRAANKLLRNLDGRVRLTNSDAASTVQLTATDASLYAALRRDERLQTALEAAGLSGVAGYRAVRRLLSAGLVSIHEAA